MEAIQRFTKEDPTFRGTWDDDIKETIASGMGELHLEIYAQRMEREYNCAVTLGKPRVAFRESLYSPKVPFDGAHHEVDSSDWAFTQATQAAFEDVFEDGTWVLLEPIMNVEVTAPEEFQGSCVSAMSQRNGVIKWVSGNDNWFTLEAEAPLNDMFGYSSDLRSKTQGKGEYSMEYTRYSPASPDLQDKIIKQYKSSLAKEEGPGGKKKTKN